MPAKPRPRFEGNFPGWDYTAEETAWLLAMGDLKRRLGRHPTPADVLAEARRLGYRRAAGKPRPGR